jgi:calcineurin-like phosphoesterase family protein
MTEPAQRSSLAGWSREAGTALLLRRLMDHLESPNPWREGPLAGAGTRQVMKQAQSLAARNPDRALWDEFVRLPLDKIWVWSDLHLGHANIIRFTGRPVSSVDEMNSRLFEARALIPDDAWILFGGDLAWRGHRELLTDFLSGMRGRKMLMWGNHDSHRLDELRACGFEAITAVIDMPLASPVSVPVWDADSPRTPSDSPLLMDVARLWWSHYPLHLEEVADARHDDKGRSASIRPPETPLPAGVLNIHGHIHEKVMRGPFLNISVEQQGLAPERLDRRLARGVLPG